MGLESYIMDSCRFVKWLSWTSTVSKEQNCNKPLKKSTKTIE